MLATPKTEAVGIAELLNLETHTLASPVGCVNYWQASVTEKFENFKHIYFAAGKVTENNYVHCVAREPAPHITKIASAWYQMSSLIVWPIRMGAKPLLHVET